MHRASFEHYRNLLVLFLCKPPVLPFLFSILVLNEDRGLEHGLGRLGRRDSGGVTGLGVGHGVGRGLDWVAGGGSSRGAVELLQPSALGLAPLPLDLGLLEMRMVRSERTSFRNPSTLCTP